MEYDYLKSILECSPDIGIFIVDKDYKYLIYNSVHEKAVKREWNIEISIGMSTVNMFEPKYKDFLDRALSGETFSHENKRNNEYRKTYFSPLIENSEVVGAVVFLIDTTQEKTLENNLTHDIKKINTMLSNISDVVSILDVNGKALYRSPNVYKLFGWTQEELDKKQTLNAWEIMNPEDRSIIQNEFLELIKYDLATSSIECRYRCKDGSEKIISIYAINMLNDPLINGILVNYHDITQQILDKSNLEDNISLLDALIECSPVISVFALDLNYRYIAFNRVHLETIKQMYGADVEIDMCMLDFIPEEDKQSAIDIFNRSFLGEHVHEIKVFGKLCKQTWEDYQSPIYSKKSRKIMGLCCFGSIKDA